MPRTYTPTVARHRIGDNPRHRPGVRYLIGVPAIPAELARRAAEQPDLDEADSELAAKAIREACEEIKRRSRLGGVSKP